MLRREEIVVTEDRCWFRSCLWQVASQELINSTFPQIRTKRNRFWKDNKVGSGWVVTFDFYFSVPSMYHKEGPQKKLKLLIKKYQQNTTRYADVDGGKEKKPDWYLQAFEVSSVQIKKKQQIFLLCFAQRKKTFAPFPSVKCLLFFQKTN